MSLKDTNLQQKALTTDFFGSGVGLGVLTNLDASNQYSHCKKQYGIYKTEQGEFQKSIKVAIPSRNKSDT